MFTAEELKELRTFDDFVDRDFSIIGRLEEEKISAFVEYLLAPVIFDSCAPDGRKYRVRDGKRSSKGNVKAQKSRARLRKKLKKLSMVFDGLEDLPR